MVQFKMMGALMFRYFKNKTFLTRKKFLIVICIIVLFTLVLSAAFLDREKIGSKLWITFKEPNLALMFNGTSDMALEIGNYYFNVYDNGVYDLNKAQKYFYIAIRRDSQVPDAWHQLARIDFLKGNFDSALKKINRQISIHGDSFMASYYIRGLVYGYMKEYDLAEKDFLRFLEWDPNNWAANNDLAWIYFSKGEYENALSVAGKALEVDLHNAWALNMYGVSLLNLEKNDEAAVYLKRALTEVQRLKLSDWHKAYPGNHPQIAETGLREMERSIRQNLDLTVSK